MNTYDFYFVIANKDSSQDSINKIVQQLKKSKDYSNFSLLFSKLSGLIVQVSRRYFNLTDEDKESFAAEELWKAINDYDSEREASFITFFKVYYINRLKMETNRLNYQKRKANYMKDDSSTKNMFYGEVEDEEIQADIKELITDNEQIDKVLLELAIMTEEQLSNKEKKYCKIIIQNNCKDIEAAELLGITPAGIHYMKKRIRKKLKQKIKDFI